MYRVRFIVLVVLMLAPAVAAPDRADAQEQAATATGDLYAGAPYLGVLRNTVLYGDIWTRPELSVRDRSLITVAANQALYRTEELRLHVVRALDNGVTQDEISELVTHVAFYGGWPTGVNASRVAAAVFGERGLPVGRAEPASLVPQPGAAAARDEPVPEAYAGAPYLGVLRNSVLFGDVWERSQLSKRDRSLITIAVAQALYATEELRVHVGRGLDNGLTREEISELITHIAFYSGWPTGVNASRVAAEVFRARGLPVGQPGPG